MRSNNQFDQNDFECRTIIERIRYSVRFENRTVRKTARSYVSGVIVRCEMEHLPSKYLRMGGMGQKYQLTICFSVL